MTLTFKKILPGRATSSDVADLSEVLRISSIADGTIAGHCPITSRNSFQKLMQDHEGAGVLMYRDGDPAGAITMSTPPLHDRPPPSNLRITDYTYSSIAGAGRELVDQGLELAHALNSNLIFSQLNISALARGDFTNNGRSFGLFMRRLGCQAEPVAESQVLCPCCRQHVLLVGADWIYPVDRAHSIRRLVGVRYRKNSK